jgi:2-keto-3-deoxy-L-fuconate dehydrogenase
MLQRLRDEATSSNKTITDQYDNIPLGRLGKAEELAKTFAFLLSDDSSWTTGTVYLVDGGVSS